jgi:hypothetical protein
MKVNNQSTFWKPIATGLAVVAAVTGLGFGLAHIKTMKVALEIFGGSFMVVLGAFCLNRHKITNDSEPQNKAQQPKEEETYLNSDGSQHDSCFPSGLPLLRDRQRRNSDSAMQGRQPTTPIPRTNSAPEIQAVVDSTGPKDFRIPSAALPLPTRSGKKHNYYNIKLQRWEFLKGKYPKVKITQVDAGLGQYLYQIAIKDIK